MCYLFFVWRTTEILPIGEMEMAVSRGAPTLEQMDEVISSTASIAEARALEYGNVELADLIRDGDVDEAFEVVTDLGDTLEQRSLRAFVLAWVVAVDHQVVVDSGYYEDRR